MQKLFQRTELLFGRAAMENLAKSRVAVFGIGGVGGYAVEALARSGVGAIDLIDSDRVSPSNVNRQIIATLSTVGKFKVDAAAARIADINPDCRVTVHKIFYLPSTHDKFDFKEYSYIIDAIDTVAGKLAIIENAAKCGTPVISCMGAGNKLDPTAFEVADIFKTSVCPLAKVMRRELKKRGIDRLKVVYSREEPVKPLDGDGVCAAETAEGEKAESEAKRQIPGSVAFVPSVAGLIIAGEVIKDLAGLNKPRKGDSD